MTFLRPLALAGLLAPVALHAQPTSEIAQVQQFLRGLQTMTADFQQTDAKGRSVAGTLLLKRPGRVRFQYQKGVPLLVVGDGKALTMIDYQVRQVSRYPIGKTPLAVLLDPTKDIAQVAKVVPSGDPNLILLSAADPKHRDYGSIVVAFSRRAGTPGGVMLAGWTVTDPQNNRTTVRLAGQKLNMPIADDQFRWTDPRRQGPRG